MDLKQRKCVPCEGGVRPLDPGRVEELLTLVPGWQLGLDRGTLHRKFRFGNFVNAMAFVDRMASLAEGEGHHPDFCVHYSVVDVSLSTHAIGGLSENDFVMAAKIDGLISSSS